MTLDRARTLSIGMALPNSGIRTADFFDSFNINELNFILWHPENLPNELAQKFSIKYHISNDSRLIHDFSEEYDRKVRAIEHWISDGNVLVIFPYHFNIPYTFGPPGAQAQEYLNDAPLLNLISTEPATGNLVTASTDFTKIFEEFCPILNYKLVITATSLIPLFFSSSRRRDRAQVVGGIFRLGEGALVFSPPCRNWAEARVLEYLAALADLPSTFARAAGDLPAWTEAFRSKSEEDAGTRMRTLHHQIALRQAQSDREKEVISAEKRLKLLYSGTGDDLVTVVSSALRELGLKVVEGPKYRADLIIWDGCRLAAAEVKGLDGAVRENNFRQAERWIAEVNVALTLDSVERSRDSELKQYAQKLTELGIDLNNAPEGLTCRGIMIIGTHRRLPLVDRNGENFPNPVVRLLGRSNVAALTGLDLYCAVQEIRAHPDERDAFIDFLLSGAGVLPSTDWRKVISLI